MILRVPLVTFSLLLIACLCQEIQNDEAANKFYQYKHAVMADPSNCEIRFEFGWWLLIEGTGDRKDKERAIYLLEGCFDPDSCEKNIVDNDPFKAFVTASLIGRYHIHEDEFAKAHQFITMAHEISKRLPLTPQGTGEACVHLQLATMMDSYPSSNQRADASLQRMTDYGVELLGLFQNNNHRPNYAINEQWLSQAVPGAADDPYVHCVLTLFPLSFYYRADVAKVANQHYQLAAAAFPDLLYTALSIVAKGQKLLFSGAYSLVKVGLNWQN